MITRFRIESAGTSKKEVASELQEAGRAVVALAKSKQRIAWEITDEALTGQPGHYVGRIVVAIRRG